ncbi:MAG: hypothetical protein ITG02_02400 [Patulibacter sp.]|nr:hypothetical protein [Patulibacter sp.]
MGDQNAPERMAWAIRERDDSQTVTGDPILASRAALRGLPVVELVAAAAYDRAITARDEARAAVAGVRELLDHLDGRFAAIRRNDATPAYEYGQARKSDGEKPGGGLSARWLEPRDLAWSAQQAIKRWREANAALAEGEQPAPDYAASFAETVAAIRAMPPEQRSRLGNELFGAEGEQPAGETPKVQHDDELSRSAVASVREYYGRPAAGEQSTTETDAPDHVELVRTVLRVAEDRGVRIGPSDAAEILGALSLAPYAPASTTETATGHDYSLIDAVLPAEGERRDELLDGAFNCPRPLELRTSREQVAAVYDAIRAASSESEGNDHAA